MKAWFPLLTLVGAAGLMQAGLNAQLDVRVTKLEHEVDSLRATIESCCVTLHQPDADIQGVRDLMVELRKRMKECGCGKQ